MSKKINTTCPQCKKSAISNKRKLIPIYAVNCMHCDAELNVSKKMDLQVWVIGISCAVIFFVTRGGDYYYIGWLSLLVGNLVWQAIAPLNVLSKVNNK
jgi:hypothetical protein